MLPWPLCLALLSRRLYIVRRASSPSKKLNIMITSFFAPKSKTGRKRTAEDEQRGGSAFRTKKVVVVTAPPSESSSASDCATTTSRRTPPSPRPPCEEAAALLSFLCDDDDEGGRRDVPNWRSSLEMHFATSTFSSLAKFVARERASHTVYPPPRSVFSALNLTPLHRVKGKWESALHRVGRCIVVNPSRRGCPPRRDVSFYQSTSNPTLSFVSCRVVSYPVVIVGQDPYHQPNQGHGLSFSVPRGVTIPPSLRNIYKELINDADVPEFDAAPRHGNLERWATQGVLLLNNVLTVRRGEAAMHGKSNPFTVLFRALCSSMQSQCSTPLGATKTSSPFIGSRCFSRANEELVKRGWKPIDWRVDGPLGCNIEKISIMEEGSSNLIGATEDFDV
ncbi:hypothetical protein ACHAW5_009344 [Stephanodiscus triporus]|uniref:Uracil-DNA glycosylase-like domain-containing protein n=1 Tax=Stephanodiscus triporus TaxID=2934178 RepID=A0ABD3NS12_9STRA